MQELHIKRNQLDYIGAFAKPAFVLWGESKSLFEGLYHAFAPFNVTLSDFRIEGNVEDPSSQSVKVLVGSNATFRFRFDRFEVTIQDFSDAELSVLTNILASVGQWIRSVVPEFKFQSHITGYVAHCDVAGSSSRDFLHSLRAPELSALGKSSSSGLIFHGEFADHQRTVQLTLDHSLAVKDGLFVNFASLVTNSDIDYASEQAQLLKVFDRALNELGLTREQQEA
jgi:hypothetical protein